MKFADLEQLWKDQFLASRLVEAGTHILNRELAYYVFYGEGYDPGKDMVPANYKHLYSLINLEDKDDDLEQLVLFLHFAGITVSRAALDAYIGRYPTEYDRLFASARDIFKTLAHYGELLDVRNPFRDNKAAFYLFLNIELGYRQQDLAQQPELFRQAQLPELYHKKGQLPEGYEQDDVITRLFHEIETTHRSFFITGKAGTGKSTFLHFLAGKTSKKVIMLAFTGIAAINIGGQTLHSFFKFPFKPLLPNDHEIKMFGKGHPTRKLIEQFDLLVIDEVSMLRADVLDAVDYSLRMNGGNPALPFGGKQVLFVGDVFQLPPVVNLANEVEHILFTEIYKSAYFFDALAYQLLNPVYFEFTKVHRQKDDLDFVELLDQVRTCTADAATLTHFNTRHYPNYAPGMDEFVMHLTTRNQIAQQENTQRLAALPFPCFEFEADVDGDFQEDRYPTARTLELKKQAQVIFVKNDGSGRWVNGTIAKIEFLSQDHIEVRLQNGEVHALERTEWENRKYNYDKAGSKIHSEVVGTFKQYPIKLAWAITIHKSQGLTFDKVVIDMGTGAFVNGQTYTALSRCRTLKGIALKTRLRKEDIITDPRVLHFHHTEQLLHSFSADEQS